jgi:hypothetical protein
MATVWPAATFTSKSPRPLTPWATEVTVWVMSSWFTTARAAPFEMVTTLVL